MLLRHSVSPTGSMGGMKISISLPDKLVHEVDRSRGDISRSLYIRRKVERGFGPGSLDYSTPPVAPLDRPTVDAGRSPKPEPKSGMPRELPEHLQTGHPSVRPTHPAYQAQLAQIEEARRRARA